MCCRVMPYMLWSQKFPRPLLHLHSGVVWFLFLPLESKVKTGTSLGRGHLLHCGFWLAEGTSYNIVKHSSSSGIILH